VIRAPRKVSEENMSEMGVVTEFMAVRSSIATALQNRNPWKEHYLVMCESFELVSVTQPMIDEALGRLSGSVVSLTQVRDALKELSTFRHKAPEAVGQLEDRMVTVMAQSLQQLKDSVDDSATSTEVARAKKDVICEIVQGIYSTSDAERKTLLKRGKEEAVSQFARVIKVKSEARVKQTAQDKAMAILVSARVGFLVAPPLAYSSGPQTEARVYEHRYRPPWLAVQQFRALPPVLWW
jgi:hypothetical protein